MDEATAILKGDVTPIDNAAVLTFDDGYLNNFTQALPVLREFGIPGVFYVATGVVESRKPYWFDRLDFVLQAVAGRGIEIELDGRKFDFDSDTRSEVVAEYARVRAFCKKNYTDDRKFAAALDDLAADLERETGVSLDVARQEDPWASVVSNTAIRGFAQEELVSFGGHSVSHLRLSCSTLDKVRFELEESKRKIEEWSEKECKHFAYPSGAYDEASAKAVERGGYLSAVTSDFGFNAVGDDVFTLKRVSIAVDWNRPQLLARASGLEMAIMRFSSSLKRLYNR